MTERLASLAETVLAQCQRAGAQQADVLIEHTCSESVSKQHGFPAEQENGYDAGIGLRVFAGRKTGWAAHSGLSPSDFFPLIENAVAMAGQTAADPGNRLWNSVHAYPAGLDLYDNRYSHYSNEEKLFLIERTQNGFAAQAQGKSIYPVVSFHSERNQRIYANSLGVRQFSDSTHFALTIETYHTETGGRSSCTSGQSCYMEDLKDVSGLIRRAVQRAGAYGAAPDISRHTTLVLSPDAGREWLNNIFNLFNGDYVQRNISLFASEMNQQVASETVTLIDQGNLKKGVGSAICDGEGIPSQRTVLIENGMLKNFIFDVKTACACGTAPTGNAMRFYDTLPLIAPANLFLENGTLSPETIIRETRTGLYITDLTGSGVDCGTGRLSYMLSGYCIGSGEIQKPFHNLKTSGHVQRWLKKIDAVGNDLKLDGAVCCPTFRIRDIRLNEN